MSKADLLNKAIIGGDIDAVKILISEKTDVNFLLGMRGTALCAALSANQTAIAHLLIDSGCGVNVEDFDKEPPLFLALRKESFGIVKKLIAHPDCKIDKKDQLTGMPPLCYAAMKGYVDVVTWMLDANCNVNVRNKEDNTALHLSVKNNKHQVTKLLINAGLEYIYNSEGLIPLHIACGLKTEFLESALTLLSKWFDCSTAIESGNLKLSDIFIPSHTRRDICEYVDKLSRIRQETPLYIASFNSNKDTVEFLLHCHASPNHCSPYSQTPLMVACMQFENKKYAGTDIIELLLENGANVESPGIYDNVQQIHDQIQRLPALAYAINMNSMPLTKLLVKRIVLTDAEPVIIALQCGYFDIAWYLIQNAPRGDNWIETYASMKLLDYISVFSSYNERSSETLDKIVTYLIDNGCSVNDLISCDKFRKTPLHKAIELENVNLVQILLEHGADVRIPVQSQSNPLLNKSTINLGIQSGNFDLVKLILLAGIDIDDTSLDEELPIEVALSWDENEYLEIVWFLLNAGCKVSPKCSSIDFIEPVAELDTSDESSYSDADSDGSRHGEIRKLTKAVKTRIAEFPSLYLTCVRYIRRHFQDNRVSFRNVSDLPLPRKVTKFIAYNIS